MGFDMNYKIEVGNKEQADEAQELFFQLGFIKGTCSHNKYPKLVVTDRGGSTGAQLGYYLSHECKEVSFAQLRDLVVLKRNSIEDATHIRGDGKKYFHARATDFFYQFSNDGEWLLSKWINYQLLKQLKPIEKKEMKEYLIKINGAYKLCNLLEDDVTDEYIEIPEGSVKAYLNRSRTINFVNADDDYMNGVTHGEWVDTHRGRHESSGHQLVWQRESPNDKLASAEQYRQAEVLPFIDDEPKSAWGTQVGGDHYKKYKIQPMLFALENNLNPLQHSVLKYIMRHEDKNGKQDLEKAKHYIDLMIAHYYPAE